MRRLTEIVLACTLGLCLAVPGWSETDPYAVLAAAKAKVGKPDRTLQYGPDALERGDLRLPAGPGPFPVAVMIHGGCWRADYETMQGLAPLAEALTKRGIATWNLEFRRVGDPGGGWPGTFQDLAAGIDDLPALAATAPLDLKRVAVIGHSSGAHLALWAASRSKLGPPWGPGPVMLSAVVAIDGPARLAEFIGPDATVCGQPAIIPLMGGTPADRPDAYRLATPADHLPLGLRQLLVGEDFLAEVRAYAGQARAAGDPVQVLELPKATHFDLVTPGTKGGAAVVDFIAANLFAAGKSSP